MSKITIRELVRNNNEGYLQHLKNKHGLTTFYQYIMYYYGDLKVNITSLTEDELEIILLSLLNITNIERAREIFQTINMLLEYGE